MDKRSAATQSYQRLNPAAFERMDSLESLDFLDVIGNTRLCMIDTVPTYVHCFHLKEAADALGVTHRTMENYVAWGFIPAPVILIPQATSWGDVKVYSDLEMIAIIKPFAAHMKSYRSLRRTHTETITSIRDAVMEVRESIGVEND